MNSIRRIINKISQIIHKINEIFNPVFKLVFGVLSLVLLWQANWLVFKGNEVTKNIGEKSNEIALKQLEDTAPSLEFSKYIKDGQSFYKLENSRGHMSNVEFYQFYRVTIFNPKKEIRYVVEYKASNIAKNKKQDTCWIYQSARKNFDSKIFTKYIEQQLWNEFNDDEFVVHSSSYYFVTYNDFKNERKRENYHIENEENGHAMYSDYLNTEPDNNNSVNSISISGEECDYSDENHYLEDADNLIRTIKTFKSFEE